MAIGLLIFFGDLLYREVKEARKEQEGIQGT